MESHPALIDSRTLRFALGKSRPRHLSDGAQRPNIEPYMTNTALILHWSHSGAHGA